MGAGRTLSVQFAGDLYIDSRSLGISVVVGVGSFEPTPTTTATPKDPRF